MPVTYQTNKPQQCVWQLSTANLPGLGTYLSTWCMTYHSIVFQSRLFKCPCMTLDCLCRLTDAEITDNILLLLHAGHETSSIALSRMISDLADHPEAMQQLRTEQAVVVEQHGEAITAAALKSMTYADAVIR